MEPNRYLSMETVALITSLKLLPHTASEVRVLIETSEKKCFKYPSVSQLLCTWQNVLSGFSTIELGAIVYIIQLTQLDFIVGFFFLFHFKCLKTSV